MKIITDNTAYIQRNDVVYLSQSNLPIPESIITKILKYNIAIIDNNNKFELIEFNKPEEIEFFKSLDWIIDYDKVKDLSENEIMELIKNTAQEENSIVVKFNSIPKEKI